MKYIILLGFCIAMFGFSQKSYEETQLLIAFIPFASSILLLLGVAYTDYKYPKE